VLLFSLSPLSFLETTTALRNARGKKGEERWRQMKNWLKNRVKKTLSLLLLKGKGNNSQGRAHRSGKAERRSEKSSLFPI